MARNSTANTLYNIERNRIEEKFLEVVKKNPEKIALQYQEKQITYIELENLSSIMAKNLVAKLPEHISAVGICMKHSPELIALILALYKLGKHYIPIRPDLPFAYANNITQQSNLKLLVYDYSIKEIDNLSIEKIRAVDLVTPCDTYSFSAINKHPEDLAYIIYTSGTTGTPKGVMIKHLSVTNLISSAQKYYEINNLDVIPWFHSYAFDFSIWEIWAALLNGAKLVILDSFIPKAPRMFTQEISKNKITFINQTPTALKQWINYLSRPNENLPDLSSVRIILTGGEALYPHHVEKILLNKVPLNARILNMYGITEDSVHSTIFEIKRNFLRKNVSIIGKMIHGKKALILSNDDEVQPIGTAGELVISGFGVAKGYLNDKELTQNKFIKIDGFSEIWYKTGDYVKLFKSKYFQYIGRKDSQIKIRGYRIAISILEEQFYSLKSVTDVKFIINNNQLLAFLILTGNINIEELAKHVKSLLPPYMWPDKFISIDEIPRTINNKIDEEKLLTFYKEQYKDKIKLPRKEEDPVLEGVISCWEALLNSNNLSIDDRFFDSGGNSLLLVHLQEELEKKFPVKISIIEFFSHSSIVEMADLIKKKMKA